MQDAYVHPDTPPVADAWKEAQDYGIDTSALLANLGKSVLERIRNHDRALNTALALHRAVRDHNGRL